MVLLCLLTLSLLVQTAMQEFQEWKDVRKRFGQTAANFFMTRLAPTKILHIRFSGFEKCPHQNRSPYGIVNLRMQVSCPFEELGYCGLLGTGGGRTGVIILHCQFAAELNSRGRPLAALCYENTTTDSGEELAAGGRCKKWSYPGTELPQLQLPDYLKSTEIYIRLYDPAKLESFSGNSSRSQEVDSSGWPRNIHERTGFAGKGKLEKYGGNAAVYLLITRHTYGTTKVLVEDTDDYTALPQFWVKKGPVDDDFVKRKVQKLNMYCKESEIDLMVKDRQRYHRGYLKNRYNTDNAWLEGTIIHLHDDTGGCFSPYPVHAEIRSRQYRWQVLPNSTTLSDFALSFGIKSGFRVVS